MRLLVHGIGSYPPGAAIGPARWPHHDLIVVTAGSVGLQAGRRRLVLRAGDAVLLPPAVAFHGRAGADGGGIWVQHFAAPPADLPPCCRRARGAFVLRGAAGGATARALLGRIHELHSSGSRRWRRAALLRALLSELAAVESAGPGRPAGDGRLAVALRWAGEHPGAARNLGVLAAHAGCSVSHFRAIFRRERRGAAGAWLRSSRLAEAQRLLRESALPLKEIAVRVGYADAVSFNRAFTRRYRVPPGRYRRAVTPAW